MLDCLKERDILRLFLNSTEYIENYPNKYQLFSTICSLTFVTNWIFLPHIGDYSSYRIPADLDFYFILKPFAKKREARALILVSLFLPSQCDLTNFLLELPSKGLFWKVFIFECVLVLNWNIFSVKYGA